MARTEKPLVFVTVGTDHHPFDRLMRWVGSWLASGAGQSVRCLVQNGTSRPPRLAEARDYMGYEDMEAAMTQAVAVVTHGGPGSVMKCRGAGKRPIVVPRRHHLGEHVDDHQVAFSRRMASEGQVALAEDEVAFRETMNRALADPQAFLAPTASGRSYPAIERFGEVVGELLTGRSARRSGGRQDRQRVLYIGGWGRSGSTLLDRMIGQVPGFVSVGELREVWQRGLVENRSCGCGEAFQACPFWAEVGRVAFGRWSSLDLQEVLKLRYRLDRGWSVPLLMLRRPEAPRRGSARRYSEILRALYRGIATVAGAQVVVDSSKLPSHALLTRLVPTVDLRLVHLVRDSRGVVYSWEKHLDSGTTTGDPPRYLERYRPAPASARYVYYNGVTALAGRLGIPYLRVRYEDLMASPRIGLQRILRHAGAGSAEPDLSFLQNGTVILRPGHTVDGNPMRFAVGSVTLRVDDEWRQGMSSAHRLFVTALTSPTLLRYGYRLGASRDR